MRDLTEAEREQALALADLERDRAELITALSGICTAYRSDGNTRRQRDAFATGRALLERLAATEGGAEA